jgi:hypothetical protein
MPMQAGSPRPAETNLSSDRRPVGRVKTRATGLTGCWPQSLERDEESGSGCEWYQRYKAVRPLAGSESSGGGDEEATEHMYGSESER